MQRQLESSSVSGDFSQQSENMNFLEDIDPSLEGGYEIVYDREVPLELRTNVNNQASQEVGSLESIKVKILILSDEPRNNKKYSAIKIEFTSETDLFFFYVSIIDEETFLEAKQEQGIKINFDEYLNWLIKLFNQCFKEPHNYFGVFRMEQEGIARLDFIENMEYKFLDIITVDFMANPDDLIKQNVIYRYNILKAKMMFVQSRLEDISNLIKLKNPSLLVQIQKSSVGGSYPHAHQKSQNGSKYLSDNSRIIK